MERASVRNPPGGISAADSLQRANDSAFLNAFVTVVEEPGPAASGPLEGMPIGVKDMIDTAGLRTTYGSLHFADHMPAHNADCVEVLVRAGAVVVGKTTTHEFANGPTGDSSINGAALNPWDQSRIAGGSSAGSASAVAAGIVPFALGTDTGGSARIPAALCGVLGFKPTLASVSLQGVFPLAPSLDTVGFLARDPSLLAQVWRLFDSGSGDPVESKPGRRKLGFVSAGSLPPVDRRVGSAVQEFATRAGATEISLPGLHQMWDLYRRLQGCEAYAIHRERMLRAPELFQSDVRERLADSADVRAWEYLAALKEQHRLQTKLLRVFNDVDVIVLPTVPIVAPALGLEEIRIGGRLVPVRQALLSLTSPWSVLGWPAISVPAVTVDGLPAGVQLVAAPGRDSVLLELAEELVLEPSTYKTKEQ